MSYSKEELIEYRVKRAYESLEEAKLLSKSGHWNTTVNRLYYAVYYIVSAYLIKIDQSPGSHSGTKTLFNQELIKNNKLDFDSGKLYNNLFNMRHESDYGDFQVFTRDQVEPLILKTEAFLSKIKIFLY